MFDVTIEITITDNNLIILLEEKRQRQLCF